MCEGISKCSIVTILSVSIPNIDMRTLCVSCLKCADPKLGHRFQRSAYMDNHTAFIVELSKTSCVSQSRV
ncbi:hypothetical protein CEXT_561271 [Caerostris extrusa]|uniref:Uncharacterized protein n=1 Tax=Caerostris extrusa TaxID=172846 RepID=A0AAV4WEQ5_CAEEX|nr:hypothetical protein CEXT_561271 [Caerostris extrusa]